jgi:hypothetical protein
MTLQAAQADLAALLSGITLEEGGQALEAYPYVPEAITPPCLVQEPADTYVSTEGTTFSAQEYLVSVDVFLLLDLQDNEAAAKELDTLLGAVLAAVRPSDWFVQSVSKPQPFHTTEWLAHGVRLTLGTYTTL